MVMQPHFFQPAFVGLTDYGILKSHANVKGLMLDYAQQMNNHVTQMAAEVGLTYDFDRAVVANSVKAHRFSHLAKKHGLGDKAEEALFKAYFTEGLNIDDNDTLINLGT